MNYENDVIAGLTRNPLISSLSSKQKKCQPAKTDILTQILQYRYSIIRLSDFFVYLYRKNNRSIINKTRK